ncbi:hypothetical protein ACOWMM_02085 [Helicobacter pylori]|uniref:hypothetical protein n=1 Tax=Helicobacter pylori TaxID=210 RepID=UPI0003B214C0|nr:hypothetical protein [Helicobacter pylori]ERM21393.1 hypothetical protein H500_03090 [Helicobacter pylori CG-IMSS-2012]NHA17425.1 hypothetical protein [Helicobacter pylori]NHA53988.1 hypothetical protein [Helicobacter pylori]OPG41116.1 hypothetical protein BGL69_00855 [Helicobacter pylori]WRC42237.1 hypothetical protein E5L15_02650 [Helicobacter pylori]
MLANDFMVKKLKNKELHGLLCNKLSKRVDRFGYRAIGVGADKETNEVIVQLNKGTMARLSSKTALANDDDFMAGIFDEFNELKANKEPQKPNSFYYGYGSSYKIIDVLNDKDGDFISCRLLIVKELGVDECLGFYVPPMIDNNNTALADLLENGEPAIHYEANSANIRRFLDKGPYNIEWLVRKYLGVGFRSCKIERIQGTEFAIKFRYKKWGSMIDREVKRQFPKYLKDSKKTAVKITSKVFYELLKGTLFGNLLGKDPIQAIIMRKENNNK